MPVPDVILSDQNSLVMYGDENLFNEIKTYIYVVC